MLTQEKGISVTLVSNSYVPCRNGQAIIAIFRNRVSIADEKAGDSYVLATGGLF